MLAIYICIANIKLHNNIKLGLFLDTCGGCAEVGFKYSCESVGLE